MIRLPASELRDALRAVAPAIAARPPADFLSAVRVESTALSATDWETWIRTQIDPATDGEPLDVSVSHKLLTAIAAVAKGDLTLSATDSLLTVQGANGRWTLPLVAAELTPFPAMPPMWGSVMVDDLAGPLKMVGLAAGRDQTQPFLLGVQILSEGKSLVLQSTDRYRIHRSEVEFIPSGDADQTVLVEAKTIQGALSGLSGEVTLNADLDGSNLGLIDAKTSVLINRMDATFPPVGSFFGGFTDPPAAVRVSARDLLDAAKSASPTAGEKGGVLLSMTGESLSVSSADDAASASVNVMVFEHRGRGLNVLVSPRFLSDALDSFVSRDVVLSFTSPLKPMLIESEGEPMRCILMPIRDAGAGWLD